MKEIRCKKCDRLLFKTSEHEMEIEIKCPKCGYINNLEVDKKAKHLYSVKNKG